MTNIKTKSVYMIRNIHNGKVYIGVTIQKVNVRWNHHKKELRKNTHYNRHLQRAWNKYKEDSFEFSVIYETKDVSINIYEKEIHYIKIHNSYKMGYNGDPGGIGGPNGRKYKLAKPVRINGRTYRSIRDAAEGLGIKTSTIDKWMVAAKNKNSKFFGKYIYLEKPHTKRTDIKNKYQISRYETVAVARSIFKAICEKRGLDFNNFIECKSEIKMANGSYKYFYKSLKIK